jgi:hypothetical protein
MSTGIDKTENPKRRPPLGLPTGSVRAILTLLILTVVIVETARGHRLEELWSETLLIALAHYFTSRRFIGLSPALLQRLENEGEIAVESHPLFLPRFSIRLIIVAAFGGLAYFLYHERGMRQFADVPPILITVAAYLLGIVARGVVSWRIRRRPQGQPFRFWEDLKALAVILAMLGTAIPYFLDQSALVPEQVRSFALAFVLFYFGSR